MQTQNPNPELLSKIKEQIKKEIPHSRAYAKFISTARIVCVLILAFLSILTLAIFFTDILQKLSGSEFENYSLLQNIFGFLFEFLVLSLLGIIAIYGIYRSTDWPFVKERLRLIIGSFIIICFLSIMLVILSEREETVLGDFLDGVKDRVEDFLPFRNFVENDKSKPIYHIEGTIISIEKNGRDFIIEVNSEKEKVNLMLEKRFGIFQVGDEVKLDYEIDGDERDVEMIEKINY